MIMIFTSSFFLFQYQHHCNNSELLLKQVEDFWNKPNLFEVFCKT